MSVQIKNILLRDISAEKVASFQQPQRLQVEFYKPFIQFNL